MTLFLIIVLFCFILAILYNTLVARRYAVDNSLALIDTQLKKRFDLIPNLVACVQSYAKHERETFAQITELRARAAEATPPERRQLGNEAAAGIGRILVAAEAYPELRAAANFRHLMRTLNEAEEQISAARRCYNAAVTNYNTSCEIFPYVLIARMFHFEKRELFSIAAVERETPEVSL